MSVLNVNMSAHELSKIFNFFDRDGLGEIEYSGFLNLIGSKKAEVHFETKPTVPGIDILRYQVEEDMRVPLQSTPIPMEVVAQSAIEQKQEQEQSLEQGLEGGGPTEAQEKGEKQRSEVARVNKMRNAVTKFNRNEVLGRKHEYFHN